MELILEGFMNAINLMTLAYIAVGVFIGLFVGAIPGLSAAMAIALCIPLTYGMPTVAAIGFLIGINKGGCYGAGLSAILLNTPGSAEAVATTFDGYPLAQQGKGIKAIKMSLVASVFGDIFSTLLLIVVAAPIASFALKMGPSEVCSIIILSLTLIAALESQSLTKGILAAAMGMFVSTIGVDPVVGQARLTFDIFQLESGIRIVCLSIGLLALSELLVQTERLGKKSTKTAAATVEFSQKPEDNALSFKELIGSLKTFIRSSFIGAGVGALPGLGAGIAGFLAYGAAKKSSKDPESFGKGNLDGVAASESSNNAVIGSALIPLFTLGIPGNVSSAILIGAFILHGINPGPLMFEQYPTTVYGIYGAMLVGNVALLGIGYLGIKFFTNLLQTPKIILLPIIMYICLIGTYLDSTSSFNVGLTIIFALVGYFLKKLQFSFVAFIVGFILGPMLELSLQQSLISYGDNLAEIFTRPATITIIALNILFIFWQFRPKTKKRK